MSEPGQVISPNGRLIDPDATSDERSFSVLLHLSLLGHIIVPYLAIAIPVVMYMVKKGQSPFIDDHAKESINFQLTLLIYSILLPVLAAFIAALTCGVGLVLIIPAMFGPYILGLIGMIMATRAANRGEFFRYPMSVRFLS